MVSPFSAIALYIPDQVDQTIREQKILRGITDGAELDFIAPAWWEHVRTVRLLTLPSEEADVE